MNDAAHSLGPLRNAQERLIVSWAILGIMFILARALARLTPLALQPFLEDGEFSLALPLTHAIPVAAWVLLNAYSEGYRGFHRAFVPRVVVRAVSLARAPRWDLLLLAPVYAMGLIHAKQRRLLISWTVLTGIAGLVLAVRRLDQPLRGYVDLGVVVGLFGGAVSLLVTYLRLLGGSVPSADPDLP